MFIHDPNAVSLISNSVFKITLENNKFSCISWKLGNNTIMRMFYFFMSSSPLVYIAVNTFYGVIHFDCISCTFYKFPAKCHKLREQTKLDSVMEKESSIIQGFFFRASFLSYHNIPTQTLQISYFIQIENFLMPVFLHILTITVAAVYIHICILYLSITAYRFSYTNIQTSCFFPYSKSICCVFFFFSSILRWNWICGIKF